MKLNENYKKYPQHYYVPENIEIDDNKYKLFLVRFNNLYEIYELLKSNPAINKDVFSKLSSEQDNYDFAGMDYKDAVEDLINFNEDGYANFLKLIKDLTKVKTGYKHEYELKRTLAGGHLNIPAYSTGSPLCYESYERIKRPKFIKIHSTLSYPWFVEKSQVLNRAIILVSIINALERNGYNIDLNTFELAKEYREIFYVNVKVKNHGERTNLQTLYKTNCHVEFLRRILFRILETSGVEENWQHGYGQTCSEDFSRQVLNINKDDIYFGTPNELEIYGDNLAKDFKSCLKVLNLKDKFDIKKIDAEFNQNVKNLVKKK